MAAQDSPTFLMERKMPLYLALIILLASLAVFSNSLLNGFVWDDRAQVLENHWLTSFNYLPKIFSSNVWGFNDQSRYLTSYYRPLMHVIYLFTAQVFGLRSWGFHIVNIMIHAANSFLVFIVIFRLMMDHLPTVDHTDQLFASFFGALFFAIHPAHTEVVAWVAGIPELSFSFLCLLSFYMYIRSGEGFSWRYSLAVLFYFLASLCKEPALTLPILLFAYDRALIQRRPIIRSLKRYIPFLTAAVIYLLMRYSALKGFAPALPHKELSTYQFLINTLPIFVNYIVMLILPVNLSFIHEFHPISTPFESTGIFGAVATLIYFTAIWWAWMKNRTVFVGLVFVVVPLLPSLYIRAIPYPFAERYLYLPSAGFALLVAVGMATAMKARKVDTMSWRNICKIFMVLVVAVFSIVTVMRNRVWKSDYTLWQDTVQKAPNEPLAHTELGRASFEMGMVDQAINEYRRAIILKQNLKQNNEGLHNYLGTAYLKKGLIDAAIQEFQRAVALNGNDIDSRNNLGSAYLAKGMPAKAAEQFEKVLAFHPDSVETLNNLGLAFKDMNRLDQAIGYYQAALQLRPDVAGLHYNLARAYVLKGMSQQAAEEMHVVQQLQQ